MSINKNKNILMLLCMGILVIMCASIILRFGTRQVLVKRLHMNNAVTQTILFDAPQLQELHAVSNQDVKIPWEELYPFADGKDETITRYLRTGNEAPKQKITSKIEKWTTEYLLGYYPIVELGRHLEDIVGWRIINPKLDVLKMADGYLTYRYPKVDVGEHIESLKYLNQTAIDNNSKLLYIQAPFKVNKYGDKDINGRLDFSNANADELLQGLAEAGIDTLDLREVLNEKVGREHFHELFFRTDHHWKPETGLMAAEIIARQLQAAYDIDVDFSHFNLADYEVTVYKDWFLGSQGKKVTLARTSPDDIALLKPNFTSKVHVYLPTKSINADGDFSLMLEMRHLDKTGYYTDSPYNTYIYGDQPLMDINNLQLADFREQNVLIIKDSFANAMSPFLAMGLKHLTVLDLRHFNGSVAKYIETAKPTVILVLYNPAAASQKIVWDHSSLFDFR
ncbi:MAG: hypothetical protein IJ849_10900 [Selenomonadaceae bacterium]|nr:hypothetical protein [Selenomonadaceae bacterium]